jgi:chemotaxis protein methyltransferase CheR
VIQRDLQQVAEIVRRESGIRLQSSHEKALRAALRRAFPDGDAREFLRVAADPDAGPLAVERLLEEVTVKETYFLRERGQLEAIPWQRLLDGAYAAGAGTLHVWSAACATGEEAYSLAMLACEALGTTRPPVRVLGTDLSEEALDRARRGHYRERSARGLDAGLRDRYFTECDGELAVSSTLRALVEFKRHNLAQDRIPPRRENAFDLVLCRNVLIYFDAETVSRVVSALEQCVRPDGLLILGVADALSRGAARVPPGLPERRRPTPPAAGRELRRPLGREPARRFEDQLALLVRAADEGRTEEALRLAGELLEREPLNADVYYLRGLVELEAGDAAAAVASLRRALYVDQSFGLAAFKLGRALDALGERVAARRAYERAVDCLGQADGRHAALVAQVDLADVESAARARLAALR